MEQSEKRSVYEAVKRIIDVFAAIFALTITAPILVIAGLLIKLDGGPIFFVRWCTGRNGRRFGMLKLRTMVPNAHEMEYHIREQHAADGGYGIPGEYADPRITRVGAILRLTNLDELPQIINILKGEMSLVGPRPVTEEETFFYGEHRDEVLSVRPGLSGYWQIKRRMSTDYDERVRLDCHYVRRRNLLLDAYIFFMTPIAMITSDYNSLTKPLHPLADDILIPERAVVTHSIREELMTEPEFEEALG